MQRRIRKASNEGFLFLTEGINFDVALARATRLWGIEKRSREYLEVRYLMARMLYEW